MPIIKSAIKRAKQAVVRRERNVSTKKDVKSTLKAFMAKPSVETLSAAHSEIDTAVKKNVLNKHTAARRKSALSKIAKEAGVKPTAAKKAPAKAAPKTEVKTEAKPAAAKKPATKTTAAKTAVAKKPATKTATAAKKAPAKKPAAKKA